MALITNTMYTLPSPPFPITAVVCETFGLEDWIGLVCEENCMVHEDTGVLWDMGVLVMSLSQPDNKTLHFNISYLCHSHSVTYGHLSNVRASYF